MKKIAVLAILATVLIFSEFACVESEKVQMQALETLARLRILESTMGRQMPPAKPPTAPSNNQRKFFEPWFNRPKGELKTL